MFNKILPNSGEIDVINSLYTNCLEKFKQYVNLLLEENENYNLIGKNTVKDVWSRHIIDSLQLTKYIDVNCKNILDLGSGAGLPAIVLGITTGKKIIMVEKSPVKANFLSKTCSLLELKFEIVNQVISKQNIKDFINQNTTITSRAFKSLYEILDLLDKQMNNIDKILLLKGKRVQEEIDECNTKNKTLLQKWNTKCYPSILDNGCLLECIKK